MAEAMSSLTPEDQAFWDRVRAAYYMDTVPADQERLALMKEILVWKLGEANWHTWLTQQHPDLGMRTPQQVIDEGYSDVVLQMLVDALMGDLT